MSADAIPRAIGSALDAAICVLEQPRVLLACGLIAATVREPRRTARSVGRVLAGRAARVLWGER